MCVLLLFFGVRFGVYHDLPPYINFNFFFVFSAAAAIALHSLNFLTEKKRSAVSVAGSIHLNFFPTCDVIPSFLFLFLFRRRRRKEGKHKSCGIEREEGKKMVFLLLY